MPAVDFSCVHPPPKSRTQNVDKEDYAHFSQKTEFPLLQPPANVESPMTFCEDMAESGKAPGLMDFNHGTTTLAFKFKHGVIVAVDSRASQGTYISSQSVRKIIEINPFLLGTMAGGAADCMYWERYLNKLCRLYELENGERIPVKGAATQLANIFNGYRGYGLSAGTMICGWDKSGPHIHYVDNDASCIEGNLFSVGSGSLYAYGVLDAEYHEDLSVDEAVELGKRAIFQATHRDGASGGVVRVYHIKEGGWEIIHDGLDVKDLYYEYEAKEHNNPTGEAA